MLELFSSLAFIYQMKITNKYGQALFSCNAKRPLVDTCFGGPYVFGPFWIETVTSQKTKTIKIFLPRVRLELTAFRL